LIVMVTRVDEVAGRAGHPRSAVVPHAVLPRAGERATLAQRLVFVASLWVFGAAAAFTAVVLLARVTPALFPGQTLGSLPILDRAPLPIAKAPEDSAFNKRISLLIIGVDRRPDSRDLDADAYNTDTLMVATIDPVSKQMSLLSMPRDLLIKIHHPRGYIYEDRVNASYAAGILEGKTFQAGAEQLQKDLEANFGIQTDYWVIMDFRGVARLVDAVGGVEVDIPHELSVRGWWYSETDEWRDTVFLSFPPGVQHLDGFRAVAFGRYREDSDLYRVKRQQLVANAALAAAFSRGILNTNPFELWDAYSSAVQTNVPRGRMPGFAVLLKQTNGTMRTFSLGDPVDDVPTVTGWTTPGGASVLLWNPENVQSILSQVFPKASWSASNVEIRNGFGANGDVRARALGRFLKYQGLPTVSVGPDVQPQARTEIVLYVESRREMAEDIAKWMGMPATSIVSRVKADPTLPDVLIIVGQDFSLPGG
jgi:LCP family protein required for cell wall assembly